MCADGLYQSQMVAVFQHAKGCFLSDRKPWKGDVIAPAGGTGERDGIPVWSGVGGVAEAEAERKVHFQWACVLTERSEKEA